tara:strand:- start:37657 stop:38928 length:1272 start_codon:yes stop_codon:yes gene_type:complete
MGFLDLFRRPASAAPDAAGTRPMAQGEGLWGLSLDEPGLGTYLRGDDPNAPGWIGAEAALRNVAVLRCVDLIAGTMGSLPFYVRRMMTGGRLEDAINHPLFDVLLHEPNNWQSPFDFKSYMQANALIDGNAYALVLRSQGRVIRLIPLDPKLVCWKQNADWSITYSYSRPTGGMIQYPQDEILHLRGLTRDGISGVSRTRLARDAIDTALQAELAASRLFRNGLLAGGVLTHPKSLSDPAVDRLKASLDAKSGAANAHKWLIVEEGMDLKSMPSTGLNSQHIEQRKLQIEEIARAFGVPRPLLMMDDTSWGSGIEQLGILFVRFGLAPWFKAWEEAIARVCFTREERRSLKVDIDERELLRGSMKDQGDFYAKALGAGGQRPWMTSNEVRDVTGLSRSTDPEADKLSNPMTQPQQGGPTDGTT